jgi:hypothetical protein
LLHRALKLMPVGIVLLRRPVWPTCRAAATE